jgi:hypothetical protein
MPIKTAVGDRHAIIFKRLGPSSVKVTSDVYAHVIGSASRDADERAAALMPRRGMHVAPHTLRAHPAGNR